MAKIEVSDTRDGEIVMNGLIGKCDEMFEIRLLNKRLHYWVRNVEVPREAWRDAFDLAMHDRFDPADPSGRYVMDDHLVANDVHD